MTMQIRKAERKKAKLRLGMAAPTGAGKTVGALLIAYGITGDWAKVGLIDTEAGSGELYVGQTFDGVTIGEYEYIRIEPDFTASKYIEAQKMMEAHLGEGGVVIIDSTSHLWAGVGGLLDKQGKIADRTGNSYTAWRNVTPDHNQFVEGMLASPCHIIATMRAKMEYVQEKNDQGKTVVKKVGLSPVQRDGIEYEFTVMLDIDSNHYASASKDRTNTLDGRVFKINPKTGQELLAWLETGRDERAEAMNAADVIIKLVTVENYADFRAKAGELTKIVTPAKRDELITALKAVKDKIDAANPPAVPSIPAASDEGDQQTKPEQQAA